MPGMQNPSRRSRQQECGPGNEDADRERRVWWLVRWSQSQQYLMPKAWGRLHLKGAPLSTIMVYSDAMPAEKQVRRSVTLPAQVAKQVDGIAKRRQLSDNRVL